MTGPMFQMARARHTESKIGQLNPLRRAGDAHEIADVALWLASSEASYVNGQAIVVDGGLSSSLPVMPPRHAKRETKPAATDSQPAPATANKAAPPAAGKPMFIL